MLNVSFVCFLSSLHVLQITIPSLDREEVLVPGDLAGEDPHLVDEVKKGWRRWTAGPLTSDILMYTLAVEIKLIMSPIPCFIRVENTS